MRSLLRDVMVPKLVCVCVVSSVDLERKNEDRMHCTVQETEA